MFTEISPQQIIKKNTRFWFEIHPVWQTVKTSNFLWMFIIKMGVKFNTSLFPFPEFKWLIYAHPSFRILVQKDRNLFNKISFINKVGHYSTITQRNISYSRHTSPPKTCRQWKTQVIPKSTPLTCHSIKWHVLTQAKFIGRNYYGVMIAN